MPQTTVETEISRKQAIYLSNLLLEASKHLREGNVKIRITELDIQVSIGNKQIFI